jgi:hypothetical protein
MANKEERAFDRASGVLNAMASEMYPAAFLHVLQYSGDGSLLVIRSSNMKSAP